MAVLEPMKKKRFGKMKRPLKNRKKAILRKSPKECQAGS
jgi:hypothetical protein